MAVVRYSPSAVMEFLGLSTDVKPNATNAAMPAPKIGDRFIEADTGKVYAYMGAGTWTAVIGAVYTAGA